jgi:hypothetical protein
MQIVLHLKERFDDVFGQQARVQEPAGNESGRMGSNQPAQWLRFRGLRGTAMRCVNGFLAEQGGCSAIV